MLNIRNYETQQYPYSNTSIENNTIETNKPMNYPYDAIETGPYRIEKETDKQFI